MRRPFAHRPRKGAFVSWAVLAALAASPLAGVCQTPAGVEALRVYSVGDQLIDYLAQAARWVDQPASRVALGALSPKVRAAVLAHPEARLASEQRETAALAKREAFAGFLPQVSANLETGNRNTDLVNTPWSFVPAHQDNSKAIAITGRQLLYDFGAVGHQVDARGALETAAAARGQVRRSELALRAMNAWLELFRGQQTLEVSRMNVLSRRQILSFVDEREQLGASAKSEVLRARARLADAEVTLVTAQNKLTAAQAAYREVFDEAPPEKLPLPELTTVDLTRLARTSDWLPDSGLLSEARAQTQAAGFEARSAAAALLPSFNFELSARRRDLGGSGVPGLDWSAGVVVKQNLYSGGADVARKQQAEQRARESQLEQDRLARQVERSAAQAVADVRNSDAAIGARKEAMQVAATALAAVREQFAFRRGNLLDLLRAQEELYLAGRDLVDGVVDQAQARYRLLHLALELHPLFDLAAEAAERKE
jgi:adhesin transport system outer membrane protein